MQANRGVLIGRLRLPGPLRGLFQREGRWITDLFGTFTVCEGRSRTRAQGECKPFRREQINYLAHTVHDPRLPAASHHTRLQLRPISRPLANRLAPAGSSRDGTFHWTAAKVVLSLVLFVWAGFAEIGGGWLVWQAVRCSFVLPRHCKRVLVKLSAAAFARQRVARARVALRCNGTRQTSPHATCRREGKKWWWAALGGLILIGCAAFADTPLAECVLAVSQTVVPLWSRKPALFLLGGVLCGQSHP